MKFRILSAGVQNETCCGNKMRQGLEGESGEDIGPVILGRFGWFRDDPELALGMMDDGYGVLGGGANGPASA